MTPFDVHFTLTRHNEPTVILVESPLAFRSVEIKPKQLREIAALYSGPQFQDNGLRW